MAVVGLSKCFFVNWYIWLRMDVNRRTATTTVIFLEVQMIHSHYNAIRIIVTLDYFYITLGKYRYSLIRLWWNSLRNMSLMAFWGKQ